MDRTTDSCRCCGGAALEPYLDLGEQPLANSYHQGEAQQAAFPLRVAVCPACFHSQLTTTADVRLMFDHYLYVSGTSQTLREYFARFVDDVLGAWAGEGRPRVLEIGCNDGTLLGMFHQRGCEVLGVDPAANLQGISASKGLTVLERYWNTETAAAIGRSFDLIIAVNVLPHVPDPLDFLAACRRCLAPRGAMYVQTSQCDMFLNGEFDAVYHEHHSYFTAHSFGALAGRAGLRVEHAGKVPIHSASFVFRLGLAPREVWVGPGVAPIGHSTAGDHDDSFSDLLGEEHERGLTDRKTYHHFAHAAAETRRALAETVHGLQRSGRKVIGYGASAKGNTVLNYAGIDLDYIVDDNPLKWGYQTPGRNIPIESPERLGSERQSLGILCLAWNFQDEIIQKIRAHRGTGRGDQLVFYVPVVNKRSL